LTSTTSTYTYLDLPTGFGSAAQLCESMAGLTYALARTLPQERRGYQEVIDFLNLRDEDAASIYSGVHPECWAAVWPDDSMLIRSNADDEVWRSISDYVDAIGEGDELPGDRYRLPLTAIERIERIFGPSSRQ